MPYVDLNTIHNPATGTVAPASWGDQVRDNDEFLIDPPAVSIKESTAQSITNVTDTALTSDEENYDNNGMHSTVSNTTRLTAQTAGRYLVWGQVQWAGNTGGFYRQMFFRVNGTTQYLVSLSPAIGDVSVGLQQSGSRTIVLAVTDYVELMVRHNAGGALNCTMGEFGALFLTR